IMITQLLSTRRFLPIFIAQFIGAFSDNLIRAALVSLLTYRAVDLDPTLRAVITTMALGLYMVPFLIFSATGGKLADLYNKARLIQWIKFITIFFTIFGIIGFYTTSYTMLLIAIFLAGISSAFFGPAKYSILPDHLKKDELLVANGLIEAGTFIGILIGIILGDILVSNPGNSLHPAAFLMLFASIVGYVSSLFIPSTEVATEREVMKNNFFRESLDCITYARKYEECFLAILGISWFWLVGGLFMSQLPSFTRTILGGESSVLVMLLTFFTLGTAFGSMFCNKLLKGKIDTNYVPISILLMTFMVFGLWVTSSHYQPSAGLHGIHYFLSTLKGLAICVEIFFISFFGGIYIVPLYAFLQIKAKKSHRSRIIAANNILNAFFMVTATLIVMALLFIGVNVSEIILLLGIVNFFTAAYICRILPDTVIRNIFQSFFKIIFRVEVKGIENFHKAGNRVLIIANHVSFLDPPLIGAFLPKKLVFAVDTMIAKSWWLKPFLVYLKAYPVDPTNPMAVKSLIEKLKEDNPVVIFPEGRLTVTGSLMKIYEGPGLIADKAGAKLLPIRLDGVQFTPFSRMHGKLRLRLFPKITVTIMEPQTINVPDHIVGRERRQIIGNMLYDVMSNMMFKGSETTSTLFESLIDTKAQFGGKFTIVEDADYNKVSYNRLIMGSFLLGKKIAQKTSYGERVGVFLPNAAGSAVIFFACHAFGRVPAMLNFSTGTKNMIIACESSGIKTIYTSRRFVHKADFYAVVDEFIKNGLDVIFLEDVRGKLSIIEKITALYTSFFPKYYYKKYNNNSIPEPNTAAVILFTSGSEGTPKGVVLSHSNIQSNIRQASSRVDFTPADKVFNSLPLFHSFGLTLGFIMPVLCGVRTFFYPSPLHYRIIPEIVYGTNSTILCGTDTFLAGYAKFAHPYDFYSVRYIFAGAEKLKDETRRTYMDKFGIRIFEGYGATEASPVVSVNTPMHYKAGTVGRLLPNIEYRIEKVKGIERGGKLIIKGPNVMLGYLKTDKPGVVQKPSYKINGKLVNGWYDTGDIVDIDNDSYITILGREKRFAKVGGEMISLAMIEELIGKMDSAHSHAVVNIPHDTRGETLVLYTTNKDITRETLLKFTKAQGFTELFVPKIIAYIDEIPVLGTGKVNYVLIKEMATQLTNKDKDVEQNDN
ncbi:MAG: acyl-[ACP]--phospholipid O-acyltransferase, partial [Rickettsiales bacterium]